MKLIGCDFHTRFQAIAMVDTETGELVEQSLNEPRRTLPRYPVERCCAARHWLPAWSHRCPASFPSAVPLRRRAAAPSRRRRHESGHRSVAAFWKGWSDPAKIHSTSVPETRAAPASQPPATRFLAPNPGLRNSPPAAAESRRPVPDSAAPSAGRRTGVPEEPASRWWPPINPFAVAASSSPLP